MRSDFSFSLLSYIGWICLSFFYFHQATSLVCYSPHYLLFIFISANFHMLKICFQFAGNTYESYAHMHIYHKSLLWGQSDLAFFRSSQWGSRLQGLSPLLSCSLMLTNEVGPRAKVLCTGLWPDTSKLRPRNMEETAPVSSPFISGLTKISTW